MTSRPPVTVLDNSVAHEPFAAHWFDIASADHFWMAYRVDRVMAELERLAVPSDAPLKAIDVGSGHGAFRGQMEARTRWTIDCCDLDIGGLERTPRGRGRRLHYDITTRHPSMEEAYDVVFAMDVLEHVAPPEDFVEHLYFLMRPGGWLVVNVPAIQHLFSPYDRAVGHLRRYNKRLLREHLGDGQLLDVRTVQYWGMSMVPALLARIAVVRDALDADTVIERGFAPPSDLVNRLMYRTLRLEGRVLGSPPLGTSLLALARRPG